MKKYAHFFYSSAFALILTLPNNSAAAIQVSASDHDGNIPENTLDSSLSTRWSAKGDGQWIRYDLGKTFIVDDIDIAFYKGSKRVAYFDIALSEDGKNWATYFSGVSRQTRGLQNFNLPDTRARFVQITGYGNSSNAWNSITEVAINTLGVFDSDNPATGDTDNNTQEIMLWQETFNKPDGTQKDSGKTAWSLETDNLKSSGRFAVSDGALNANNTGREVAWVSDDVDISQVKQARIAATIEGLGRLDATDYIRLGYRVDGGSTEIFDAYYDDLERTALVSQPITGNSLQLVALFRNTAKDEHYRLLDIAITGIVTKVDDNQDSDTDTGKDSDNSQDDLPVGALDPTLPPGGNFDLSRWKITFPDASEKSASWLVNGGQRSQEFFTDPVTGGMIFRCPNAGETTSSKTKYSRTELREMLRGTNDNIPTKGVNGNNWVLSTSSNSVKKAAGGVDGYLAARLSVDHVSTTGDKSMVGRVIVGQIHGSEDEPFKLYYRKLPGHTKGSVYFTYEKWQGDDVKYLLIGSAEDDAKEPGNGIKLGEKWRYSVDVNGREMTVKVEKENGEIFSETITIESDYNNDWLYFKAGVYNQNNGGEPGDYVQATFYELEHRHY